MWLVWLAAFIMQVVQKNSQQINHIFMNQSLQHTTGCLYNIEFIFLLYNLII